MTGIRLWVHVIGWLEGLSAFALMGIAMPMKYFFDSISKENFFTVGMVHGVLWVGYALIATAAAIFNRITWQQWLLLGIVSLFPLGPILADRYVLKDKV